MGKRYDWEVTPQNTPRFKEKQALVLLANGLFILNMLIIAICHPDDRRDSLICAAFAFEYAVLAVFEKRKAEWGLGSVITACALCFLGSAAWIYKTGCYWYYIGYGIEMLIFILAAVLMFRRRSSNMAHNGTGQRKQMVVRMNQTHRIGVITLSSLLIVGAFVSMIVLVSFAEMELWAKILLCIAPVIPMLIFLLYYASWQITFDSKGIHKQLFWIAMGSHSWAQVREVRASYSHTEQEVLCIYFKDGKTVRFRMICENADKARKLILTHNSIIAK